VKDGKDLLIYLKNHAILKFEENMELFSNKLASFNLFSNVLNLNEKNKTYRFIEMIDFLIEDGKTSVCFAIFDNGIFQKKLTKTYIFNKEVNFINLIKDHFEDKINNNNPFPDLVILPNQNLLQEINEIIYRVNINTETVSVVLETNNNIKKLYFKNGKSLIIENDQINIFINKMRTILFKEIQKKNGTLKWED